MAAALEVKKRGIDDILILEREDSLGGILIQCIHTGFGLQVFKQELTGPEYAWRYIDMIAKAGIVCMTGTTVLSISPDRMVEAISTQDGHLRIRAGAVILAMGCRERTRGALNIPGTRPSGIITAGTAQKFVNIYGYMPGKKFVILGSGDIGLIMARRLTLEGAEVKMVCEIMPKPGGLTRNVVQCLYDFDIPLKLRHTVIRIHGGERLEGVTVAEVDDELKTVQGSEEFVECDTLLLSVGLIPENELTRAAGILMDPATDGPATDKGMATSMPGVFACGNVVRVHDLVDNVTRQGELAGRTAAAWIRDNSK